MNFFPQTIFQGKINGKDFFFNTKLCVDLEKGKEENSNILFYKMLDIDGESIPGKLIFKDSEEAENVYDQLIGYVKYG